MENITKKMEKIILKNKIENLNIKIENLKESIVNYENNMKTLKYGNILISAEAISLIVLLPSILPLRESFVVMLAFCLSTKGAFNMVFGSKRRNSKMIIKDTIEMDNCIIKKENLENEFNNIKTNTNNEEIVESKNDILKNSYVFKENNSNDINAFNIDKIKKKIKSIVS